MHTTTCRSCGAAIVWARTERGKMMPVDALPTAHGNLEIKDGVAYVIGADGLFPPPERYTSHFVTCPQAAEHRKGVAKT